MVEIPDEIKKKMEFVFVETMDQVLKLALADENKPKTRKRKAGAGKKEDRSRRPRRSRVA